jgi:hypothetical protein
MGRARMADEKKKREEKPSGWIPVEGWVPVDPNAANARKADANLAWQRPSSQAPAPAPVAKSAPAPSIPTFLPAPAPAAIPKQAPARPAANAKPADRRLWADPVLSPWAQGTQPVQPTAPAAPPPSSGGRGQTQCPRCGTSIAYVRSGSPPWLVTCPSCGAQGKMHK